MRPTQRRSQEVGDTSYKTVGDVEAIIEAHAEAT